MSFRRKIYYMKNASDTLVQRSATLERINKQKFATKNKNTKLTKLTVIYSGKPIN